MTSEWDEAESRARWEEANPDATVTWAEVRGWVRGVEIGTAWEHEVVDYLRSRGFDQARRWDGHLDEWREAADAVGAGMLPPPDVLGVDGWALELKDRADAQYVKLSGYLDQAEAERAVAGDRYAALISKRRGRPIDTPTW